MSQLDTTNTFVDGNIVNAASLNNMIDQASALSGLITDGSHAVVSATSGDKVLLSRAGALKQADVSTFPGGGTVTSVSSTITSGASVLSLSVATPGTTPEIRLGLDVQGAGKFLAGPVSGVAATPTFRALVPSDLPVATVDIAAAAIDWSLGNVFKKTLSANITFSFSNPTEGQVIRVLINQDASHTVTWPVGTSGVFWPAGAPHTMTLLAGRHDIVTLHYIGGHYYGTFDKNFLSV